MTFLRFTTSFGAFTFDLKDSDKGQWFRLSVCVGNSTMKQLDHVRRSAQQVDAQAALMSRVTVDPVESLDAVNAANGILFKKLIFENIQAIKNE